MTKNHLIVIVSLAILGGLTFFASGCFSKDQEPANQELVNVKLKDEVITFTSEMLPDFYPVLVSMDNEIVLVDQELERFEQIEKEFPKKRSIVLIEQKDWKRTKNRLIASLFRLEKEIVTLYVSYSVNPENGLELIDQKQSELIERAEKSINASNELTQRLKVVEEKSFIDKLKDKFL